MIRYKSIKKDETGKKYELLESKVWPLGKKFLGYDVKTEFFALVKGTLHGHKGYRYDGPTGALDTADFMEGSAVHDILTDMIKGKMLPESLWVPAAQEMRHINKREGMPWIRRQWTFYAVCFWGRIKRLGV